MHRLELSWFGSPRIVLDNTPIKLETRKATALLAFLTVESRPFSREYLSALLWPEYDSDRAPANLRRTLASLQKSLGVGWMTTDRDSIEIDHTDLAYVDVTDLADRVQKVRDHHPVDSPLCEECTIVLEAAAELQCGVFLEGLNLRDAPEFDMWQMRIRDETTDRISYVYERLVERYAEDGADKAIAVARRWLSLDELNESAHRSMMLLYARSGKRNAALRQYQICESLLLKELDQMPDDETTALRDRIRAGNIAPKKNENSVVIRGFEPMSRGADGLSYRLRPPSLRPILVDRSRLMSPLNEGLTRTLTLISAPAGFGKTTLLAEWIGTVSPPAAWLSLDEDDTDPTRFLTGLAAACGGLDARVGADALQILHSMQTPPPGIVADSLTRDLEAYGADCILILDDYHLAARPEIETITAGFVQRLPGNVHLYIATRTDPAIPLPRLRARAQLGELRAADLRFRPNEVDAFITKVMNLDLGKAELSLLESRTEGWAAGLQMVALSLQGRTDHAEFIRSFTGSHRYLMDYLIGEVLDRVTPELQQFLLDTSILERLNGGLCNAVVGVSNSQERLEELERANLFILALDDERQWYRYHQLFAELLQHRLRLSETAEYVASLHRRAGTWFEDNGDIGTAMSHYLSGESYRAALRIIEVHHERILSNGGLRRLLSWMTRIPAETITADPMASALFGVFYAFSGNAADAERWFAEADRILDSADTKLPPTRADTIRGISAAVRSFLADMGSNPDRAIELADLAERVLPPEAVMTRSLIPYTLGRAYRLRGDLDKSERYIEDLIKQSRNMNNIWTLAGAIHEKALICGLRGKLSEIERMLDDFDAIPKPADAVGPIAKSMAARAELFRSRGVLDLAIARANDATSAVRRWGLPSDVCFCLQTRLRTNLSLKNIPDAEADFEAIEKIIGSSFVYGSIIVRHEVEHARILIARKDFRKALRWIEEYRFPDHGSPIDREAIEIARARILASAGESAAAAEALRSLACRSRSAGRIGRLIEILVLQAIATEGKEAEAALEEALSIADEEGYRQVFVDTGARLIPVLERFMSRDDSIRQEIFTVAGDIMKRYPE